VDRVYLAEKEKCVCRTGYEPVDGSDELDDGYTDCMRKVYDPCPEGQVRDANAKCRPINDCREECNGGPGEIDFSFGICQCEEITKVDQLCNEKCR